MNSAKNIKLEVCAYSLDWCLHAQAQRAHRVELCAGIYEGGTTPSAGLIELVRAQTTLELAVMIRPRGGNFLYQSREIETMEADVAQAKKLGATDVVLGFLRPDGSLDRELLVHFVQLAAPMGVVLHRAIDFSNNLLKSTEAAIEAGCVRILSSGGRPQAAQGIENLKKMLDVANNAIEIMAGAGVNETNAHALLNIGVHALHLSGRVLQPSPMQYRAPHLHINELEAMDDYRNFEVDPKKISNIASIMKAFTESKNH